MDAEGAAEPAVLNVRRIVISGVLGAITILLGWTGLGFIPVPNLAGNATIMHIPTIVGGVMEGWPVGAILGLLFGVFSFLRATDPIFKDPLIAILPRLFIGVTAFLAYAAVRRSSRYVALAGVAFTGVLIGLFVHVIVQPYSAAVAEPAAVGIGTLAVLGLAHVTLRYPTEYLALVISAIVGTLTNTFLVLGLAGLRGYVPWALMPPILLTNAVPEVIIAIILVVAVVTAWKRIETGNTRAKM
jgi:uncharacterized membrane protein